MKFTALLALASAANAHMIMRTPKPAGNPDSSPLSADGSNYPCKIPGGSGQIDKTNVNVMPVGSEQDLAFTGGATHGGGSCQISLAKGTSVNKDTKFMVIHSFEGNCPVATDGTNAGDNPTAPLDNILKFTVPNHPDLGAGDYTLAWTWNNKIGNREFYMNCAYVQLTDPAKKRYQPSNMAVSKRQQAPLPDVFVANIGTGCTTPEGIDVQYPNPGAFLTTSDATSIKLSPPTGNCGSAAVANPGNGASSVAASSAPTVATSAAGNTVSPVASATNSAAVSQSKGPGNNGQYSQTIGGGFATVSGAASSSAAATATPATSAASQATSAAPLASSVAPVASSAATTKASSAAAPVGTGAGSTVSGQKSGPCGNGQAEQEGAWACASDGKSFQRCASGAWSVPIQMSAGMTCVPGVSANFAYNVSDGNGKRDLRSHIARRRHNLRGGVLS